MRDTLSELLTLLRLERIEERLFRGQSQDLGWGSVFGGQVLGQSLSAAQQTVDDAGVGFKCVMQAVEFHARQRDAARRRQGEAGEDYCSCGAAIRHAGLFQRPCRAASYSGMTVGSRDSIC